MYRNGQNRMFETIEAIFRDEASGLQLMCFTGAIQSCPLNNIQNQLFPKPTTYDTLHSSPYSSLSGLNYGVLVLLVQFV